MSTLRCLHQTWQGTCGGDPLCGAPHIPAWARPRRSKEHGVLCKMEVWSSPKEGDWWTVKSQGLYGTSFRWMKHSWSSFLHNVWKPKAIRAIQLWLPTKKTETFSDALSHESSKHLSRLLGGTGHPDQLEACQQHVSASKTIRQQAQPPDDPWRPRSHSTSLSSRPTYHFAPSQEPKAQSYENLKTKIPRPSKCSKLPWDHKCHTPQNGSCDVTPHRSPRVPRQLMAIRGPWADSATGFTLAMARAFHGDPPWKTLKNAIEWTCFFAKLACHLWVAQINLSSSQQDGMQDNTVMKITFFGGCPGTRARLRRFIASAFVSAACY